MGRAMTSRAEQRAIPPRVLAMWTAKNIVRKEIRAQGLRLNDFSARDLTLLAERWLAERPHLLAEARAKLELEREKQ